MSTAASIAADLSWRLADSTAGFTLVLSSAHAIEEGARAVAERGDALAGALTAIRTRWSALPHALEAPGTVDPLYPAMNEPHRLAAALQASMHQVSGALLEYAQAVATFGPQLAALRHEAQDLLAAAQHAAVGTTDAVTGSTRDDPELTAERDALVVRLSATRKSWETAQREAQQALTRARNGLDPALLTGTTTESTSGLHGAHAHSDVDGWTLGLVWASGAGGAHQVFTEGDAFSKDIRATDVIAAARRSARQELSTGMWAVDAPLSSPAGRSLSGAGGVLTFLGDGVTILAHLNGLTSLGDIDQTYLGSYTLEAVPIAAVGARAAVVRFTVRNTTTVASGTRIPFAGYLPFAEGLDHVKNTAFATGPGAEQTQVITWTETISWPSGRARRRAATGIPDSR